MNKNIKRIPVARCPNAECQRTLLYSDDPKDKLRITTRVAEDGYKGKSMFCSRCKTMVAIIEKPKIASGFVPIPIVGGIEC
jgi:hypothetical protein